jgi:hypothetical protein
MAALAFTRYGTPMTASFAQMQRSLYVIACAFALSTPALAQVAPPELAAAEQAVQRATQADADQYAPDLVNQARQELMQAQQASLDRGQRKQAPQIALRAAADADLARARSEEAVVNAQVEQRQAEVARLQSSLANGEGRR